MYSCSVVYVTWRGSEINRPRLFYYKDITKIQQGVMENDYQSGLACRSTTNIAGLWHLVNGDKVQQSKSDINGGASPFVQYSTPSTRSSSSRLLRKEQDANLKNANGLFTCRKDGSENGAAHVGLFQKRGEHTSGTSE